MIDFTVYKSCYDSPSMLVYALGHYSTDKNMRQLGSIVNASGSLAVLEWVRMGRAQSQTPAILPMSGVKSLQLVVNLDLSYRETSFLLRAFKIREFTYSKI